MAAEPRPWEESLVLVCGPPCTGKTAVAQQHAAYHRLSFESGRQGMLRNKARLVKKELDSKGRVCLDDQHKEADYRKKIIDWIKLSTAQQALCVWCEPEGGRTQCIWANEWNMVATDKAGAVGEYMPLALSAERSDEAYGSQHKRSLESWFPSGSAVVPKPPAEGDLLAEGFHRVLQMPRLPLCPELHGTFHRAGLVIDAHAVLEDRSPSGGRAQPRALCQPPRACEQQPTHSQPTAPRVLSGGVEPIPGAALSISQYIRTNPLARVVLLVQPTQLFQRAAMDPAANERELSTRAQALEQAALSGVRALAKQVAASGHSLHYVWLTPVSKPLPPATTQDAAEAETPGGVSALSTTPASLSAEHRAASARYLACAPPNGSADGRLPSFPLAWAVRHHRLALGALLYVRGATAPSAAAAAAAAAGASKLYEGVRQLEGREFLLCQGSVPPEPIQLATSKLPRFLHPFATTAANQATSSATEPSLQEGALYGRVHGMAPCNAGASSGEGPAAAAAVAATGGAGATGSAAGSDGFRTTHWTTLEESAAPPPAAAPEGPTAAQTASSAVLSWVSSDLPSQLAYQRQLELATGIVNGGKLLTGCECRPAAPGEAFCGVVLVAKCKGSTTDTYDLELHIAQPPSAALIVRRSCGCVDFKEKVVRHIRQEPGYLCKHLTALLIWAIQRRNAAANGDSNGTCGDGACNSSCRRDAPGGDASSGDSYGGAVGVSGGGAGPSSSMIGGAAAVAGAAAASGEGTGQGVRAGGSGGGHGSAAAPQCGGSSGAGGPRAATVPAVRRMPSSFTGSTKKPRVSNDRGASSSASTVAGQSSSAPSAAARVLAAEAEAKRSKAKRSATPPVTIDLTDDDTPAGAVGSTGAGPSVGRAGNHTAPRCELEQPITAKLLEDIARATLAAHGLTAKVTAPPAPAAVAASTAATARSSSATVGAAPAASATAAAVAAVAAAPARYGGDGGGTSSALAADVLLTKSEPRAVAAKSAEQGGGGGESAPLAEEPSGLGVPKKSLYGMFGTDFLVKPEVLSASRGAAASTQAQPSSNAHFFLDDDDD